MTVQNGIGGKWWFNGLPLQTTVPKSGHIAGTQKYWLNGLPMESYSFGGGIQPNFFTDVDVFYSPTVSFGPLLAGLVVDTDTIYAPSIVAHSGPYYVNKGAATSV